MRNTDFFNASLTISVDLQEFKAVITLLGVALRNDVMVTRQKTRFYVMTRLESQWMTRYSSQSHFHKSPNFWLTNTVRLRTKKWVFSLQWWILAQIFYCNWVC